MAAFTLISRAIEFVAAQRGISEAEAWAIIKKDIWEGDLPAAGRVDKGYLVKFHPSWINYLCNFLDAEQQPRPVSYDPSDQIVAHVSREENLKHTDFPDDDFVWFDCKAALLDRKLRKAKGDNVGPPAPPTRLSDFSVAETRLRALYGADLAGPVAISTSCRTVNWPSGIDRLQVDEAAKLLQPAYPMAPIANVDDSKLRSELIKVARECDIRADIIRAGQNGLIQLVHPTLGISHGMVPESDWFIDAEGLARFAETFGIVVVGADGAPFREQRFDRTALPAARAETPSRSETEGEQAGASRSDIANSNDPEDATPNKRGPRGWKKAEATTRMVEAVRNREKTIGQLQRMKQKELGEFHPDARRTMLAEAHKEALKILRQNSGKTPTNDK